MTTVLYDGTFEGLLSAIFEIYEYKFTDVDIVNHEHYQPSIFGHCHRVVTEEVKYKRLWKGLHQKLSAKGMGQIYRAFLSEEKGIENTLLAFVRKVFASKANIEKNFANQVVLAVNEAAKKVYREKHRMEAFIRFQLSKDTLYHATCQPDFNVLPLIEKHFMRRYADQRWLIYDTRRHYGIYYDLEAVSYVKLEFSEAALHDPAIIADEKEKHFQDLWKQYFTSVNIKERKNMKLHIRHMPRRYWKFLIEKQ